MLILSAFFWQRTCTAHVPHMYRTCSSTFHQHCPTLRSFAYSSASTADLLYVEYRNYIETGRILQLDFSAKTVGTITKGAWCTRRVRSMQHRAWAAMCSEAYSTKLAYLRVHQAATSPCVCVCVCVCVCACACACACACGDAPYTRTRALSFFPSL